MLDPQWSRQRQKRLQSILAQQRLDAMVVGQTRHVYYFSAFLAHWSHETAFVMTADRRSVLVTANRPVDGMAADESLSFEANVAGTQRQEQADWCAARAVEWLKARGAKRIGIDASAVTSQVALAMDERPMPIDPALWQLRRRKDPDELTIMRKTIRCTSAMHAKGREIIEPGMPEIVVYGELLKAGMLEAGEPFTAFIGNDYACGTGGGPARGGRVAQAGELYILDLGPAYRGYYADNTRTVAVDRKPTDEQLAVYGKVVGGFDVFEKLIKPGTRCREIYAAVDDYYRSTLGRPFPHHLGHGVGLQPHEYPHLNPGWDDVLLEGEVFAAEPGFYDASIRGAMRIEDQYLVTANGFENLVNLPRGLV